MNHKIAIMTSGGDSPGMNNAVRAITKCAKINNIDVYLIFEGYKGLVEKNIINANKYNLDYFISRGGTFIRSSRYIPFKEDANIRKQAAQNLKNLKIDFLVVIGGDGSYAGAQLLHNLGIKTIGIPGTIDNDIASSDYTIGFDTALNTIVDSVDKIRDTMNSMNMVAIVEVMGHGAGDLAMYSGLATGAEIIITNQNKKSITEIIEIIKDQFENKNKNSVIIIVSEFIYEDIKKVAKEIQKAIKINTRAITLAHTQRGGIPTALERVNSSLLGIAAVESLLKGKSGVALGFKKNKIITIPIPQALEEKSSTIDKENELVDKFSEINQA